MQLQSLQSQLSQSEHSKAAMQTHLSQSEHSKVGMQSQLSQSKHSRSASKQEMKRLHKELHRQGHDLPLVMVKVERLSTEVKVDTLTKVKVEPASEVRSVSSDSQDVDMILSQSHDMTWLHASRRTAKPTALRDCV